MKILLMQTQDLVTFYHIEKAGDHRNKLGDHSCDCGTAHAHIKWKDAEQI